MNESYNKPLLDPGVIDYIVPEKEFYAYLQRLVDADSVKGLCMDLIK